LKRISNRGNLIARRLTVFQYRTIASGVLVILGAIASQGRMIRRCRQRRASLPTGSSLTAWMITMWPRVN